VINEKFGHIPYLNSSLFDVSRLEHMTTRISGLDDKNELPVYGRSVLSEYRGKSLNTLEYLFRFLDAYDFSADGGEEIREEQKTLINASVLGLIFEKINGYKDGSFYTPGFITEYMARETLRKAVVDKLGALIRNPLTQNPSPPGRGTELNFNSIQGEGRGMSGDPGEKLPEELILTARKLRQGQTDAEEFLWQLLRKRQLNGHKFRRQHPVKEGFILDFYCHEAKLGVELDGEYHHKNGQNIADGERSELLNELGIRIIRFQNDEVLQNAESVLERILDVVEKYTGLKTNPLTQNPSPPGRGTELNFNSIQGEGLTLTNIYNHIGRDISIPKANEVINSITICDPAVGSGHFLVSCLNEMLAIKSELGILCDTKGRVLRNVKVEVENDELIITYGDDEIYKYDVAHEWQGMHLKSRGVASEHQRIQQALFHEKRYLTENGLFGVDINPNSVKICRLRLWIELLKHAYYTPESHFLELEVLPNIDINIKQGNSLVSRFDLDSDLSDVFRNSKHSLSDYKDAVQRYKNTGNRTEKHRLQHLIDDIKEEYRTNLLNNRPINKKLSKERGRLELMQNSDLFGDKNFSKNDIRKQKQKVEKLEKQKDEEESGAFYNQAFEWRFEFPEVLDEDGRFLGFDVVIGNPPYIRQEQLKDLKDYLKNHYSVYQGTADMYQYFIEQGMNLLHKDGIFHYIVANKWMRANYGKPLREWMQQYQIESIIDFGDLPVFDEATTYPCLLQLCKQNPTKNFKALEIEDLNFKSLSSEVNRLNFEVDQSKLIIEGWTLISIDTIKVLEKIKSKGVSLKNYVKGNIKRGIVTGRNTAFVINKEIRDKLIQEDPKNVEIIKPFLRGRDVKRYEIPKNDEYIIFTRRGIKIKEYPIILKYLEKYREILIPRPQNVSAKNWKGRKPGNYKWFEIQDSIDYYEDFEKNKIIYPNICVKPEFTFDKLGQYTNQKCFIISLYDKALLGVLNSKVMSFYFYSVIPKLRGDFFEPGYVYMKDFPIPFKKSQGNKEIASLVDRILEIKRDHPKKDTSKLESAIDHLVYELYDLTGEEIAIVEASVG